MTTIGTYIHRALLTHFQTSWLASAHASVPVHYPNVDFRAVPAQPWVRVELRPQRNYHRYMTGDRSSGVAYNGLFYAQVFVPSGGGDSALKSLVDAVWVILHERSIPIGDGTARFVDLYTASAYFVGDVGDGWTQENVSAPYYFSDI